MTSLNRGWHGLPFRHLGPESLPADNRPLPADQIVRLTQPTPIANYATSTP
jgi:hypothetical protein